MRLRGKLTSAEDRSLHIRGYRANHPIGVACKTKKPKRRNVEMGPFYNRSRIVESNHS